MLAATGRAYDLQLYEGARAIARIRRNAGDTSAHVGENRFSPPSVHGLALLSDGTMWVQRSLRDDTMPRLDVFGSDGVYAGTLTGYHLPVGRLPNGEVLFPVMDGDVGGLVLARMLIVK